MMLPDTYKNWIAFTLATGGIALLFLAFPIAVSVHSGHANTICLAHVIGWTAAIAAFALIARWRGMPDTTVLRYVAAFSIFALSIYPHDNGDATRSLGQTFSLAGLALLLAGLLRWQALHSSLARLHRFLRQRDAIPAPVFVAALFLTFITLTVSLSWSFFSFIPGYDDSIAQYVHGKILAEGKFYASHPLQKFFAVKLMINTPERWYSIWQPLHAFMLSLGFLIHAPWLVNPLEGALTLVAIYHLARRIYGDSTARLAALLTLCCPMIVLMSSEFMNHATSLLFSTLFLLCYTATLQSIPMDRRKACLWALGAGISLGLVFLIRPLTCVGIGLAYGCYSLYLLYQQPRRYFPIFAAMTGGVIVCLLIQIWYDLHTTGEAFLLPYAKYHGSGIPGFRGQYTIMKGVLKAQDEWSYMNLVLFEWFVPSMLFILLACLRPLKNRDARLLLAMLFAFTLANMTNRFAYHIFGPRFIYETSPALIILSAAGIRRIPVLLRAWRIRPLPLPVLQGMAALMVIIIFAAGWAYRLPLDLRMYGYHYFNNHPDFYQSMLRRSEKPALIFVSKLKPTKGHPKIDPAQKYLWVAFTNPPHDSDPVIFAHDLGNKQDYQLMEYYPTRHAYREKGGKLYPIELPKDKTTHLPDAAAGPFPSSIPQLPVSRRPE